MKLKKSASKSDFTISISVKNSAQEVYRAINDVKSWWIGDVKGKADKVGAVFTYKYKTFHESTQSVIELVPNQKVVWHIDEANLSFAKNKSEWKGTKVIFEISKKADQTEVRFTHQGLNPEFECFDSCSGGWDFYIRKSLKNLITKGEGLDPGW